MSIPNQPPAEEGQNRSGKATPATARTPLDVSCLMERTRPLSEDLRSRIAGQDEALNTLICSYARLLSGLRDPRRPLLTVLLLGPTGVGKTETGKALAWTLFGSERAMIRINCEEYAHGHEVSKLLGSPPGYIGHDIEPLLSQNNIDAVGRGARENTRPKGAKEPAPADLLLPQQDSQAQSILLFDEIEKAHPLVWNALLGVLEDGMLTLGDNSTTDFTRSIILMTSNAGSREMSQIMERRAVGFRPEAEPSLPETSSVREAALAAIRSVFPLEFLNRFDEVLVYEPLQKEHLERIFDKFLAEIHERTLKEARTPLLIRVSTGARQMILQRGTDLRFGARPLRRAMERELVDPVSRLIASQRIPAGDVLDVELKEGRLTFYRRPRSSERIEVARPDDTDR